MNASVFTLKGVLGTLDVSSTQWRNMVDGMFPGFEHFPFADYLSGNMHRFHGGHDLILDVAGTARDAGLWEAYRHTGHILLTDFPTVQGVPIPFLSGGGLGNWLVNTVGIESGWLCLNLYDAGLGIIAVSHASGNLISAMAGELPMSVWTAFNTFGVGAGEIYIGVATHNPLLVFAGAENVAAGVLSAADKLKSYSAILQIDPLQFFGAGLLSTVVGFAVSRALLGQDTAESVKAGLQNGVVGALLAASTGVGAGVMLGLAAYAYGKALARRKTPKFSRESFVMLEKAIFAENPDAERMAMLSREQVFTLDDRPLALPGPRMLPEPDAAGCGFARERIFESLPPSLLFPPPPNFP